MSVGGGGIGPVLKLRRAPTLVVEPPVLDAEQLGVLAHRGPLLRVLGAPGTGKTTTAVELVVDRVERGWIAPEQCVLLTSTRLAAADLREKVTARLGGTSTEALARTHQAFGFGILRREGALAGDPTPRLLSGPEQDVILKELLEGHRSGAGRRPQWPERVHAALGTRGFRAELRDLLMRAVEHGVEPEHLASLGARHQRPEWAAAAEVLREYDEVTAFSRPGAYDPAWILTAAAQRLEDDPDALDRVREAVRLVVVDDAQELTSAGARLLTLLTRAGVRMVLVGDPDSAVQTFRGADPRFLASGWVALGEGPTLALGTAYRQPGPLREVTAGVADRIGALGGVERRRAVAGAGGGYVEVALVRAVSQEAALVAARLRAAHLEDGVPWQDMAVIVRGHGRSSTLRRVLMASGVPVAPPTGDLPVRDEVAVRPLLAMLAIVLRVATDPGHGVGTEEAVDLLTSPLGGADAVGMRRLRRALRRAELDSGGGRSSDELLAAALLRSELVVALQAEGEPLRRVAAALRAGLEAAVPGPDGRGWAPGVTAESVLWALWEASGVASRWRQLALAGGPSGARADRDLDAVVGLFDAAARFTDRLPQSGPDAFLDHVLGQDVPGDSLVARAPAGHSVALLTPAAAAGRQWRLVVVAGVQEGVWPDLRLRGSLLGSEQLVDVLAGREVTVRAAQAAVRYDETRLFHVAVSRASERLLVTAVRSDDEQPSVYLDLVDPPDARQEMRPFTEVDRPMTLTALVAALRREVAVPGHAGRAPAARLLAHLAACSVPGADPATWWALTSLSDERPLRPEGAPVHVSPSTVETFHRCSLRWLLQTCGGAGPNVGAASIGTLVHEIAADLGDVDAATMSAEVDRRWPQLGLAPGWVSERKRARAHDMVRRLAAYLASATAAGWERVGAEVPVEAEVGRAVLRGRVDRLERNAGAGLRVVDYKTGSSKPTADEVVHHPQLGAYQTAVELGAFREAGRTSAGAALLQLGKAANDGVTLQVQPALRDTADPAWAEALIAATADGMAAASFLATPGTWCSTCASTSSCPVRPEGKVI